MRSMANERLLTVTDVRTMLDYDAVSGILRWKRRPDVPAQWNGRWPGKIAGSAQPDGYLRMYIRGTWYSAHRVAWLWITGEWPAEEIDHIDGDRSNNRFANLRPASKSENHHNTRRAKNNTTGYKGVCFDRKSGKWQAQIKLRGKRKYLGQHTTAEAAYAAYCDEAIRLHGAFARLG